MNLQNGLKLLFASAVAACCVFPANAQSKTEFTDDVRSFHGENTRVDLSRVDFSRDVDSHGHLDRDDSRTGDVSHVPAAPVQAKAPEIDPASSVSALTLLIGGLAVIRGRKMVKS